MHKPIYLKNISLSFSNTDCFENFSTQIYSGSKIAIIGRNGSGKSSLLNILRQKSSPSDGEIIFPDDLCTSYVEQIIDEFNDLSGGQRLNKRLSQSLASSPNFLLLDEPTNHLDKNNRKNLMKMLNRYQGTLIIVSHDTELLRNCINSLWHIDNNKIHEFTGSYNDYIHEIQQKRTMLGKDLDLLKREKKDTHTNLMKEQKRASKSKARGQKSIEQRKWPTITSKAKAMRAEQTSGNKESAIGKKKTALNRAII